MMCFSLTVNMLVSLTLFAKTYGGTSTDVTDYPNAIIQTADGGFAVAGYTRSFGEADGDFFVLAMTPDGALQWAKGYGGATVKNDRAYSITQTTDRGYAVVGRTQSYGAGYDDFLVLKLASDGGLAWAKTFGGRARGGWGLLHSPDH
jgi:hypothetical protein